MAADFWCEVCQRWTAPDEAVEGETAPQPSCSVCGEPFTCGECGYEIDATGACQRPIGPETGYCPASVNLPTVPTVAKKGETP